MPNLLQELKNRFDVTEPLELPTLEEAILLCAPWAQELLLKMTSNSSAQVELVRMAGELAAVRTSEGLLEVERRDIAGALFDFAAWLTTRPKTISIGAAQPCAGTLADLLAEWAAVRGLNIENARVAHWHTGGVTDKETLAHVVDPVAATIPTSHVGGSHETDDGAVEPAD